MKYHQECVAVAKDRKCKHIPGVWEALDNPDCFKDGLHLSAKGSRILADLIIEELDQAVKDLDFVFPTWRELYKEPLLRQMATKKQ